MQELTCPTCDKTFPARSIFERHIKTYKHGRYEIYEQATPLVPTKPPPVGGFLSKTTIRQLAHAKRLYRTLVKTPEDEKKPRIREKLKILNKSNKWLIRQDRIAWEFRRLHLSKERGDNRARGRVIPACLPGNNFAEFENKNVYMAGFGRRQTPHCLTDMQGPEKFQVSLIFFTIYLYKLRMAPTQIKCSSFML